MGITVKKAKNSVTFVFSGPVGIEHAGEFLGLVKKSIGSSITLDMSKAEYIDTSIAQIILALCEEARKRGNGFNAISPSAPLFAALTNNFREFKLGIN